MTRRTPLPLDQPKHFSVRDALERGIPRSRLRARDLEQPWFGVRSVAGLPLSQLSRAAALLTRLPDHAVISDVSAAQLWELPLPPWVRDDSDIHVTYPSGRRAPDAEGVVGHQRRIADAEVVSLAGTRVTSLARTWCDLAAHLSLPDLVAVGDQLISNRAPKLDIADLERAVDQRVSRRGIQNLRAALKLLDPCSESRPESLMRLAVVFAGLPPVLANVDLRDSRGRFVARPDLQFADWPLVLEYDGDQHRTDQRQWRRDVGRLSAIEDLGIQVIRATADDLPDFPRVIASCRRRLHVLGWRG